MGSSRRREANAFAATLEVSDQTLDHANRRQIAGTLRQNAPAALVFVGFVSSGTA